MTLSPEQLARWKALSEAATPGPWSVNTWFTDDEYRTPYHSIRPSDPRMSPLGEIDFADDAEFIAAAREAVPALLHALEEAQREKEKAYEQGYENGESSQLADWTFALTEFGGFPDDFDISPSTVAGEVMRLRARVSPPSEERTEP